MPMSLGEFRGATLDSRKVKPGMLFVAVKGERVDGHDFIQQALAVGAAGIIDGREELTRVASEYRRSLKAKVIGVTGSAGKTTTKELIAAFLRAGGFRVHATEGNFNNDLGLPLTILNCPKDAEILVLEMGTNHPGEIAHLVDVAAPDAGVISSIGTAHIEFFKTQDGIADEKGTLFARLPPDGFAVVGVNNDRYERLRAMSAARVVSVDPSDAAGAQIAKALAQCLPGEHNVSNARLAVACAGEFGVLGDMFELGTRSEEFHERVLSRAASLPIDVVMPVGEAMTAAAARIRAASFTAPCADAAAAHAALEGILRSGDAVLLKASHGMHLGKDFK